MAQGAAQVRNMWPDILESVKNRRRFTWILLSQNAQVAGFDGTTLQLGFPNAGARDNFVSSGSEDVLKQVLAEQFRVQWKVDAIVDPSGGTQPPGGSSHPGPGPGLGSSPPAARRPPPAAPSALGSVPQAFGPGPEPEQPQQPEGRRPQPYREPEPPPPDGPPPVSLEDDTPEDDDPDFVDSPLSGHDLIVRELGATVVEEYTNE